eukprot:6355644-Alexandrium_andersonii.AAC.1
MEPVNCLAHRRARDERGPPGRDLREPLLGGLLRVEEGLDRLDRLPRGRQLPFGVEELHGAPEPPLAQLAMDHAGQGRVILPASRRHLAGPASPVDPLEDGGPVALVDRLQELQGLRPRGLA